MTLKGKFYLALTILLVVIGCGRGMNFSAAPASTEDNGGNVTQDKPDTVPECIVDLPEFRLDGNVNAFEFLDGFKIVLGYSPSGANQVGGSLDLYVGTARMDLLMNADDYFTNGTFLSSHVTSDQTELNVGVEIDFSQIKANPSFYTKTPLYQVSGTGLTKGLQGISNSMKPKYPWTARVLKLNLGAQKNLVMINAGAVAGISEGDEFNVYNVQHFWSGDPCTSIHQGEMRDANPVATLKIVGGGVGNFTSLGQLQLNGTTLPQRGAAVLVSKLAGGPKATLKRKVVLGVVKARSLDFAGGVSIDLQGIINDQLKTVIQDTGLFWWTP